MDMPPWQYEPARDLDQPLLARLKHFPRQPDMLIYGLRSVVALIIRGLLRTYCRFEIVGEEHLRNNRSFVLVANHSSHLDVLVLHGRAVSAQQDGVTVYGRVDGDAADLGQPVAAGRPQAPPEVR